MFCSELLSICLVVKRKSFSKFFVNLSKMPPRRKRHILELGLVLLLNELLQFGMENIPPLTLILILGQTFLYMGLFDVPWDKDQVCISAKSVFSEWDWRRLVISAFEHGDDMHLYYNMISFLLKGRTLEKKYGTKHFGLVLLFLIVATSILYIFLAVTLWIFTSDEEYIKSCAIGFSGVIFALKILTTYEEPNISATLLGVRIPGKYAAWIELILIHLLVPNSSFIGHFAGVLAGVTYCYTRVGKGYDIALMCMTGHEVVHKKNFRTQRQCHRPKLHKDEQFLITTDDQSFD